MDPNATLHRIEDALTDSEWHEACCAARDLEAWLRGGGFYPRWFSAMNATKFFHAFLDLEEPDENPSYDPTVEDE